MRLQYQKGKETMWSVLYAEPSQCIYANKCICGYNIMHRKENKKGHILQGKGRLNASNEHDVRKSKLFF